MTAYLISEVVILDEGAWNRYGEIAAPAIAKYGGTYLVRRVCRKSPKETGLRRTPTGTRSSWLNSRVWTCFTAGTDRRSTQRRLRIATRQSRDGCFLFEGWTSPMASEVPHLAARTQEPLVVATSWLRGSRFGSAWTNGLSEGVRSSTWGQRLNGWLVRNRPRTLRAVGRPDWRYRQIATTRPCESRHHRGTWEDVA